MSDTITTYKGFDPDWKCRDFQYAVGQTYEHAGEVSACNAGFHACEYPLDVFAYYAPAGSKFAVVEQSGDLSRHSDDTKVASRKISVKVELDLAGMVKAAVEWTTKRCLPVDPASPAFSDKDRGAASSTGDYGAASSMGYQGAASSTGKHAVAMASGYEGRAMAGETGAIFLVRRGDSYAITHVFASKVGENGIRAGVWYSLGADGKPVEVAS